MRTQWQKRRVFRPSKLATWHCIAVFGCWKHHLLRQIVARPKLCEGVGMQVGRAGRDGQEASCHLFLDDADYVRLRSLAHGDGVDATAVASFLRATFGCFAAPLTPAPGPHMHTSSDPPLAGPLFMCLHLL